MNNNIKVAIVGSGPSGLACAIELSKLGYKNIVVFERESEAGGTPRHCGHLGFGIFEFYRLLSGPAYAKKLVKLALIKGIEIRVNSTLLEIQENTLVFSTLNGIQEIKAQKIVLALGARETPRSTRLTSGVRSANIMTTGALQRYVYMNKQAPFKNAVIIGSDIVSFSAIMTARHASMNVKALVEEDKDLNTFCILKYISKYILRTPVKLGYKVLSINGKNKEISSITISKEGIKETIACDGLIYSGKFTPESAIAQDYFEEFNHTNNSVYTTQNYQTSNKNIFAAGNILRGALTAFKCYFEGKKVAKYVDLSLKNEEEISVNIPITVDENIQWYYPSMVDINKTSDILTNIRVNKKLKGNIIVKLNDKIVARHKIDASTYTNIPISWINMNVRKDDNISLEFMR